MVLGTSVDGFWRAPMKSDYMDHSVAHRVCCTNELEKQHSGRRGKINWESQGQRVNLPFLHYEEASLGCQAVQLGALMIVQSRAGKSEPLLWKGRSHLCDASLVGWELAPADRTPSTGLPRRLEGSSSISLHGETKADSQLPETRVLAQQAVTLLEPSAARRAQSGAQKPPHLQSHWPEGLPRYEGTGLIHCGSTNQCSDLRGHKCNISQTGKLEVVIYGIEASLVA